MDAGIGLATKKESRHCGGLVGRVVGQGNPIGPCYPTANFSHIECDDSAKAMQLFAISLMIIFAVCSVVMSM
jgi:hypothetical protein